MVGSKSKVKSFEIDKRLVYEAWMKVQANGGAPGVDAVSIGGFCEAERDNLYKLWNRMSSGSYLPGPVRAVEIPKDHGAGIRVLGVPNVADRIAQTAAAMLLEEKLEPIFHPDSYGYRPGRSAHDALAVTRRRCWKQDWVLDLDVRAFFDSVPHDLLLKAVAHHTDERWVLLYIKRWLTAPMQMPDGTLTARDKGTPQGSPMTPPTQLAIRLCFALRVGFGAVVGPAARVVSHRDGMADGDLSGADEHVLDEQAQDPLALGDGRGGGLAAQPGEEVFEVVGELEVDLPVGELAVEGVDLVVQAGLAGAQLGHPGPEFVEGDQLLLVGADEPGDRRGGPGQSGIETLALCGGGVCGAVLFEPFVDLGADQGRVGKQGGDVVPDDGVEVVCADRLVGADPAVLVAVVVRAEAAVVVDLLVGGAGRGAVVGVAAAAADANALQQRGIAAVAGGVALIVGQPRLDPLPGVLGDQRRHRYLQPFVAVAVGDRVVTGRGAPGQAGGAVEPGGLIGAYRLAEAGPPGVGGVAQHAPDVERSQRGLPVRVATPSPLSQRASSPIATPPSA